MRHATDGVALIPASFRATVAPPREISPPELRSVGNVPQDVARERDYLTCVEADAINMRRVAYHRVPQV